MSALRPVCWPSPTEACALGKCHLCHESSTHKSRNQIASAAGVDRFAVSPRAWLPRSRRKNALPAWRPVALVPDPDRPIGQWKAPRA